LDLVLLESRRDRGVARAERLVRIELPLQSLELLLYRLWGWDIGLGVTAVLAAIGFTAGFRARRAEKGALAAKAGMWLNLGAAASLLLPALLFYVVAYS
ncbi:MAG: hypothetical protein AAGN66_19130, partial [Acidobacteriota bacterium]